MGKLTAVAVKAALANPGTYQDGDGLFLKVGKSGAASWLVRLQQDGKRRDIGLGSAKLLTLAEARENSGSGPALLGQDTQGNGVPIPSHEMAEAVPYARRDESRRA